MTMMSWNEGTRYKDFTVVKCSEIKELHCRLIELVHIPTNAHVMYIPADDPENVFCLSFQTAPDSSDGVAHILEHTVLCGSKKFPVKDPFFSMSRRSLNTFMNALTGSDFTCYPAASLVEADFYNLLDVYIDAVFHPNLDKMSFLQEGHRLQFQNAEDPNSPLEFMGIVFNEMKGAMSSPTSRLHEVINTALFPNITYGVNSGGDPLIIPSLTYEKLLSFHQQHYHPSRCIFYFYGTFPLEKHLDFITKEVLDKSTALPGLPPLPLQKRFTKPKQITCSYPVSHDETLDKQCYISFGWLTANVSNQEELLALCIIEMTLLDTDASPLKMALLKSGLCAQVSAYLETDMSEAPFVMTLRGCKEESADAIEKVIQDTLKAVVKKGIPHSSIESAIHQLEFHRSEISGDHYPFGLTLYMRSALLKHHGAKPEVGLQIHTLVEALLQKLENDKGYFENLIIKYFIDNTHRVRVVMKPDPELSQKEAEEERKTLDAIKAKLSQKEVEAIVKQAADLKKFQKQQDDEDPDILPKICISDVPKKSQDYLLEKEKIGVLDVFYHDTFTNAIVYADLCWNLPAIEPSSLWLVRLFGSLLAQMGSGGRTYAENLDYIEANTGGIGTSIGVNTDASNHKFFIPTMHLRGKALHRKVDKLFPLLYDTATSVDFTDKGRFREAFTKHYSAMQSTLSDRAMKYASQMAASGIHEASHFQEELFGLSYYLKIREYAENYDRHESNLIERLQEMKEQLLCLENPHLIITCERSMYETLRSEGFYGLSNIKTNKFESWKTPPHINDVSVHGKLIASPVAFTSKAFTTTSYADDDSAALSVAANILDNTVLHRKVREEGGAYGGGASFNPLSGNFVFYGYRDPHILKTLKAFDEAIQSVLDGNFDETDLEEAKLEKIQDLDTPTSPGNQGEVAYGWFRENKTYAIRQRYRERLLSLTKEDVIKATAKHILPGMQRTSTAIFADRELFDRENAAMKKEGITPIPYSAI